MLGRSSKRFPVPKPVSPARFPRFSGKFPKIPRDSQTILRTGSQTRFPRAGSQISQDERFPSKVPKQGSRRFQEEVPKQGSQAKFSSIVSKNRLPKVFKQGAQEQVPKDFQRFPRTGSQEQVSKQGSQARFSRKVPKQVPKQGSQARFPRKGFQARVPRTGCQTSKVCKQGPQGRFPRTGFQKQVSNIMFPSEVTKQRFPSKAPRNRFASKVSRHRCLSKVFFPTDDQAKVYFRLCQAGLKHHSDKHLLTCHVLVAVGDILWAYLNGIHISIRSIFPYFTYASYSTSARSGLMRQIHIQGFTETAGGLRVAAKTG